MTSSPLSTDPPAPRDGAGCLVTLSLSALLVTGLVILYSFFLEPVTSVIEGMRYRAVQATIIDSRVINIKDDASKVEREAEPVPLQPVFKPEVRYSYRVDDKVYRSPRIWFAVTTATTKAKAQAIV